MKPTLLYCITNLDSGGAQQHLLQLAGAFRADYEVVVAYGRGGPTLARLQALGVSLEHVPAMGRDISMTRDLRSIAQLRAVMRRVAPALIHVHSAKAALAGRLAAIGLGIPVVYTVHGWGFKEGVPAFRRAVVWIAENLLSRSADRVICVSESEARLARSALLVPPRAIEVIENGLPDVGAGGHPAGGREPVAVMVARFQDPKRQDLLVRAMAHVAAPLTLRLVGDGPRRAAAEALARSLGVAHRIEFLGERADVDALLSASDLFVLVSDHEGLPISILEAMRRGLPVVASRVGGIAELVGHDESGILLESADPVAIAAALSRLAQDAVLRASFGAAGRRRFLERHTEGRMISGVAGVYDGCLAGARA